MPFSSECLDTLAVCIDRVKCFSVGQCTQGELRMQLVNPGSSVPVDLTQYQIGTPSSSSSSSSSAFPEWPCCGTDSNGLPKHGIEIILKEDYSSVRHISKMAVIKSEEDAAAGIVYLEVDTIISEKPGVWLGLAIAWQHGISRKHYPFYFEVTPSLEVFTMTGPITMSEVRLAVRDVCPEINFLIDTVDFKANEIAWAIRRPIEYWNEVPPPIIKYTTRDFPFRYHWMEAVVGELLVTVATWMRRNDLDYIAGGLSVGDTKKWPDYMKMAAERQKNWKDFVHQKKIEINIGGGYASLSGYTYAPYR